MTQQTDFRVLCAELTDELSGYASANPHHDSDALVIRARAALAEPEPEAVGPTDEELRELWFSEGWDTSASWGVVEFARAVLARYGHQPAPPAGELLKEAAWLRNECSAENADGNWISMSIDQALDLASLLERQAAPAPAAGEVAELVAWLRNMANAGLGGLDELNAACAADLLEQRHPAPVPEEAANPWKDALIDALVCNFLLNKENESDPKKALHDLVSWETCLARDPSINPLMRPVSVSERLPGPGDCDAEGRCWWGKPYGYRGRNIEEPYWVFGDSDCYRFMSCTLWLPATALPLPQGRWSDD